MNNKNQVKGLVIKKIPYKEHHEIVHILTEYGNVEGFFYENVYKNRKKHKLAIPSEVATNYFKTSGLNKIITLDIENYYNNIIYDISLSSYVGNFLEIVWYIKQIPENFYKKIVSIIELINDNKIDVKLANIYLIIHLLAIEGFVFRYQKTNVDYIAYSFNYHMFVSNFQDNEHIFKIDNKLVKLIYILFKNDVSILEQIFLDDSEINILFNFLNTILSDYLGITTKSYNKIKELEDLFGSFKEDNISE